MNKIHLSHFSSSTTATTQKKKKIEESFHAHVKKSREKQKIIHW